MGFFSNLKNAVTGGAATVSVHVPPQARRGDTLPIHIQATAKSEASVNAVYLLIRAIETAQVKDTDFANGKSSTETVHGRKVTYESRIIIAGPQRLQQGQSYTWDGQLPLPMTGNPSFRGQMISHSWEVQAGLDMTGNDPDSGWQPIDVS